MGKHTLSPKQQRFRLVKKYQDQLAPSKNPHIHFFRLNQATVSIFSSESSSRQKLLLRWLFWPSTRKSSSSPASEFWPPHWDRWVGNGSCFASSCQLLRGHSRPARLSKKTASVKPLNDSKIRQSAPVLKEKIAHQVCPIAREVQRSYRFWLQRHVSVKVAFYIIGLFTHCCRKSSILKNCVIDAFTQQNYNKYLKQEKSFSKPVSLIEKAEGKVSLLRSALLSLVTSFWKSRKSQSRALYPALSGAGSKSD